MIQCPIVPVPIITRLERHFVSPLISSVNYAIDCYELSYDVEDEKHYAGNYLAGCAFYTHSHNRLKALCENDDLPFQWRKDDDLCKVIISFEGVSYPIYLGRVQPNSRHLINGKGKKQLLDSLVNSEMLLLPGMEDIFLSKGIFVLGTDFNIYDGIGRITLDLHIPICKGSYIVKTLAELFDSECPVQFKSETPIEKRRKGGPQKNDVLNMVDEEDKP